MSSVLVTFQFLELVLALCISVVSTLEVYSISSSLVRGDPDLSHGLQIRRWFMGAIGGASGARAGCTLAELFYEYMCTMLNLAPSLGLLTSLRVLPTLLYYTMYTLLTVYLVQLVYTVNGMPFFHVRNVWFFANFSLYLVVVTAVAFLPAPSYIFGALFLAYAANLVIVGWYGTQIFKFMPAVQASTSTGSTGKLSSSAASSASSSQHASSTTAQSKIRARFMPLIVICCMGVSINCLNFLLLATEVLPSSASAIRPFPWQECLEIAVVAGAEIVPSLVFLVLMPKTETSFEEPSLLSIVVRAASGLLLSAQRDERYQLVDSSMKADNAPSYQAIQST